jgi:hypothetical protein
MSSAWSRQESWRVAVDGSRCLADELRTVRGLASEIGQVVLRHRIETAFAFDNDFTAAEFVEPRP